MSDRSIVTYVGSNQDSTILTVEEDVLRRRKVQVAVVDTGRRSVRRNSNSLSAVDYAPQASRVEGGLGAGTNLDVDATAGAVASITNERNLVGRGGRPILLRTGNDVVGRARLNRSGFGSQRRNVIESAFIDENERTNERTELEQELELELELLQYGLNVHPPLATLIELAMLARENKLMVLLTLISCLLLAAMVMSLAAVRVKSSVA